MKQLFYVTFIPFFLYSCTTANIPFTKEVERNLAVQNIELKSVQFRIDNALTLRREITDSKTKLKSGGVVSIQNGKYVETIKFPAQTPAIFIQKEGEMLRLAFDKVVGSELLFISYYDSAYQLSISTGSKVIYQGQVYDLFPIKTKLPKLTISNDYLNSYKSKTVNVKGMKVNN